jgi:aryl-alcohol dehydrogenase-like predicted oxidoreductase
MRLPDDEERATATIAAAADAGVTVFDTARAYGDNERLLARALHGTAARIVTKGGMARPGGAWVPDGRARAILADCEASLTALDGVGIDLYLLHAPDPRTAWGTSVRALARLVDTRLVPRVGLANVSRRRLDEALEHAPITAVQVALGPFEQAALRGGVVERCVEHGIAVIAHSPLGGPRRTRRLDRDPLLTEIARAHEATAAEVALAWLLALAPGLVAIPGATRPETARSAARAAALELDDGELLRLSSAFAVPSAPAARRPRTRHGEVVLVAGIPGAGKSRLADEYVGRGYLRLNRDERAGSLRELAGALDESLGAGTQRVVLDNTYLTRASRSYVVEAAERYGVAARCVWLDTPLAQAQVNLVLRLLDRFGRLPTPEELRRAARGEQGLLLPTSQMRALRELEPPSTDEGFTAVERVPFERAPAPPGARAGVYVAAAAAGEHTPGAEWRSAPHLVFDWRPDGAGDAAAAAAARLAAIVDAPVESAVCPHGGGPPSCWCRPPLPGLPLAFARAYGVDPARSILVGSSPAHRTLASALGASYVS